VPVGAFDPYALRVDEIEDPPPTALKAISRLGPGMVLAASIVGSGELIATTTLGAQVGYGALWVILLSCAVKPAVQAELGRYTVATGETGLEALDAVPGPRFGVSWILWAWAATVFLSLLQVGGMYGGLARVMSILVPAVPARAWALALLALTLGLVLGGGYERVEKLALVKVALFTLLTALAAFVLTGEGEHFSWARVGEGLRFRLPVTGIATAVAVYGITGVGATSSSCTRTGASRRATRASWARGTAARPGSAAREAGSA
jgi:Mn2+/Fe2+ NRAMP family transporter